MNLRDVNQLFNTMDPSPFHEKDLDRDAEEFILGWAREFPVREPVELVVYLAGWPTGQDAQVMVKTGCVLKTDLIIIATHGHPGLKTMKAKRLRAARPLSYMKKCTKRPLRTERAHGITLKK